MYQQLSLNLGLTKSGLNRLLGGWKLLIFLGMKIASRVRVRFVPRMLQPRGRLRLEVPNDFVPKNSVAPLALARLPFVFFSRCRCHLISPGARSPAKVPSGPANGFSVHLKTDGL